MSRNPSVHLHWLAASAGLLAIAVGCAGCGKKDAAPADGTNAASPAESTAAPTAPTAIPPARFDLAPATPVKAIGLDVFAKSELKQPRTIRVDARGNLFMVDYVGKQVIVVSPAGTVSARWSLEKSDALGTDIGPAGLYCLDALTLKVLVFDATGKTVKTIDLKGGGFNPRGLAVAPDGTLYMCDTGGSQVIHLSADGAVIKKITGDGTVGFREPSDVAVAADGTVAVADGDRQRVVLLSSKDEPLRSVGVPGGGGFEGIRLDEADGGFLAAAQDSVFFVPKEGGQTKAVCGTAAGIPDQLHGRAYGVAWDASQKAFYVSEPKGLQLFRLKQP